MLNADEARKLSEEHLNVNNGKFEETDFYKGVSEQIKAATEEGRFDTAYQLDTFKKTVEYVYYKDKLTEKGYKYELLNKSEPLLLYISWLS